MTQLKVTYFPVPGRAEAVRLLAAIGGLALEDEQVPGAVWGAELKPKVAPRQLPLLYIDGEVYGQSAAQTRYVAKRVGLYPRDDDVAALKVDEWVDNVWEVVPPLFQGAPSDEEGRNAHRLKVVSPGGVAHTWLSFLDKQLEGKTYAVGDALTLADIAIFTALPPLKSGWLDGVPTTVLDEFKNLAAHRELIANHPKVKAHYANAEGTWKVYQPAQ